MQVSSLGVGTFAKKIEGPLANSTLWTKLPSWGEGGGGLKPLPCAVPGGTAASLLTAGAKPQVRFVRIELDPERALL